MTRLPEPESSKGRVGAEIRSRLARYGLTQADLGGALGLSQGQVSKRLRGMVAFDIDELDLIAEFFETTVVELLGGTNPGRPDGGATVRREGIEPPTRWYERRPSHSPVRRLNTAPLAA